jgi:cytoskeletal protein CcmA (bactofilin family)
VGDLATGAVAIEEGAYFKGSIEILRDEAKESPKVASAPRPSGEVKESPRGASAPRPSGTTV